MLRTSLMFENMLEGRRQRRLLRAAAQGDGATQALVLLPRRARSEAEEEADQGRAAQALALTDAELGELGRLRALKDLGVLTQEEFDQQKQKLLSAT